MRKRVFMIAAVLGVFGVTLAWVTLHLRDQVRRHMLEQEGTTLEAVARFETIKSSDAPLDLILDMVELEGVVGVRIFDGSGDSIATLPPSLIAGRLPADVARTLRAGAPVARLEPDAWLDTEFADPFGILTHEPIPLLRVFVSLGPPSSDAELAFAEFLFDGLPLAAALRAVDRKLILQFLVAFGCGAGLILLIMIASFRSIDRKTRELAEANRELTMQAKTAAVGAVSAHLFHGLRNALASIRLDGGENGAAAAAAARHMQNMVQEIVDILHDDTASLSYSLSSGEILDLVANRTRHAAEARGVLLDTEGDLNTPFTGREGNLIVLIVENLVRNAVEATAPGRRVVMRFETEPDARVFRVRDQGPGFSEEARARLFHPVRSSKAGGSGIGLSISRQLARQLGGDLALIRSEADGSELELQLPNDGSRR